MQDVPSRPTGQQGIDRRAALSLAIGAAAGVASVPALADAPAHPPFSFTTVAGSGGVPLNVMETGDPSGPEILLIHGMSASYLTWMPQLAAPRLSRCRLVAFDMRGHGGSGKPWRPEDYSGSQIWADDVAAVIAAKGLRRPVIVAWSFGGHVALAYIRHYGVGHVAGLNLTGTLGGLVPVDHSAPSPTYKATQAASKLRASLDLEQNIEGYRLMAAGYSPTPLPPQAAEYAFLSGLLQPSYVRRALKNLPLLNADLAAALTMPILLSAGANDEEWPESALRAAAAVLPNATVSIYPAAGHYVSAEHPLRFNTELAALVARSV